MFAAIIGLSDFTEAFLHAHQVQAKVANPVEDAVQLGLIADLADEDGLLVARFHGKTLESGSEVFGQAAPDRDPIPGRLHVPPDAQWVESHLAPPRGEWSSPIADFTRVIRTRD
jgi:hypothetical protein